MYVIYHPETTRESIRDHSALLRLELVKTEFGWGVKVGEGIQSCYLYQVSIIRKHRGQVKLCPVNTERLQAKPHQHARICAANQLGKSSWSVSTDDMHIGFYKTKQKAIRKIKDYLQRSPRHSVVYLIKGGKHPSRAGSHHLGPIYSSHAYAFQFQRTGAHIWYYDENHHPHTQVKRLT